MVADIDRWATWQGVLVHQFEKKQNKEELARPLIAEAAAADPDHGKVVLLGKAQERTTVWRSWRTQKELYSGRPHMTWGRQTAFVNHFYFYLYDEDWGPAFWNH